MSRMFFLIPRVNKDVINKDNNEQVQILLEHSVHQIHENSRSICWSKKHNYKFIITIPSSEDYFQNVTISDSKIMITLFEVYLREMASTLKLVKQVINPGIGYLFLIVTLFKYIFSMLVLREPSFLFTNNTSAPQCEILDLMKPLYRRSFNYSFSSLSSAGAIMSEGIEIGWVRGKRSIPKSISLSGGTPGRSSKNTFGNTQTTGTDLRVGFQS